ncbi:SDR family oxidoreductase [Leucobacter allii]|uniref:SDR family NAD(P)-dependent oxidoreductase n=1 Tax=Leucobacter allii TaxID=2932247 RepID=UPI001FD00456|nr:SDR family NAD(P)-dependent oxidoreductase [Leucobacter allii]UOR01529.1 SDR family oxidoreductase [Leucobacter allii]
MAVVTGARGDIGHAVAHALSERGAEVWCVDIRPPESAAETGMRWVELDITDADAVERFFERVRDETGPADLLVNAAGGPGRIRTPIDEVTDEVWQRVLTLNLTGTFNCCRAAVRQLKRTGKTGSIVNISSGAGRTYSRTGVQAYAAAKAGVIGLTRQLARELGPMDIRVNCVAPGLIVSDGTREELGRLTEEDLRAHLDGVALRRLGEAHDLISPVLFFLNPASGYVTGQTVSADGGSIMLG